MKLASTETNEDKVINSLRQEFIAAYPRVADKPDQKVFLEQFLELYRDAKFTIRRLMEPLRLSDPRQYAIYYKIYLNNIHESGSILVKMGFAFCSQVTIAAEERKSFDPKAVSQLRKKTDELMQRIQKETEDKLPMPPAENAPLSTGKPEEES